MYVYVSVFVLVLNKAVFIVNVLVRVCKKKKRNKKERKQKKKKNGKKFKFEGVYLRTKHDSLGFTLRQCQKSTHTHSHILTRSHPYRNTHAYISNKTF